MKQVLFILVSLLLFSCKSPLLITKANSSHTAKLNETALLKHVEILASDSLMGRRIGSKGNKIARSYIIDQLSTIPSVRKEAFRMGAAPTMYNVIAKIQGAEKPEEEITIMAHYDHIGVERKPYILAVQPDSIYNGADDNASGVAALIEIARYFQQHPPKRTLVFLATDAEEISLLGSKRFVKTYKDLKKVKLALNMDMISRSKSYTLNLCGLGYNDALANFFKDFNSPAPLNISIGHDGLDGKQDWTKLSDHYPFHRKKIPFVYFGVEDHEDYHKAGDEYEKIDKAFFIDASNFILNSIIELDRKIQ